MKHEDPAPAEGGTGPPVSRSVRTYPEAYVPDCEEPWDVSFELTEEERAALYGAMMEKGAGGGFDDFFKLMSKRSSSVSSQIERLRTKLDAQAQKVRKRIEARSRDGKRELRDKYDPLVVKLRAEEKEHGRRGSRSALERQLDAELADRLLKDPLIDLVLTSDEEELPPPPRPSLWQRFVAALRRAWARFVAWCKRVFGKKGAQARRKKPGRRLRLLLDLPSLKGLGKKLGERFEAWSRASPGSAEKVETELLRRGAGTSRDARGGRPSAEAGMGTGGASGRARGKAGRRPSRSDDPVERTEVLLEEYISREIEERRSRLQRVAKKEREAERRARRKREELERERARRERALKGRLADERRLLDEALSERPEKLVRERLLQELEQTGLVRWEKGDLVVTSSLIERFAEIVLSKELQKLPKKHRHRFGLAVTNRGVYEKGRMLDHYEISRMDIVDSMVHARTAHPRSRGITDDDVVTKRELRGAITHVVLMFDKSGSMEENGRIDAAKRAVLALFKAVKHQDNRNSVDLVAFDTKVRVMDLYNVWHTAPSGFTNTSAALDTAGDILSRSRADRKLIYLITDGLPEAYTRDGEPRAGNPEKSLEAAVASAERLRNVEGLRLTVILLEPDKRMYIDATKRYAGAGGGSIITTDPKNLAPELLIDYGL